MRLGADEGAEVEDEEVLDDDDDLELDEEDEDEEEAFEFLAPFEEEEEVEDDVVGIWNDVSFLPLAFKGVHVPSTDKLQENQNELINRIFCQAYLFCRPTTVTSVILQQINMSIDHLQS